MVCHFRHRSRNKPNSPFDTYFTGLDHRRYDLRAISLHLTNGVKHDTSK